MNAPAAVCGRQILNHRSRSSSWCQYVQALAAKGCVYSFHAMEPRRRMLLRTATLDNDSGSCGLTCCHTLRSLERCGHIANNLVDRIFVKLLTIVDKSLVERVGWRTLLWLCLFLDLIRGFIVLLLVFFGLLSKSVPAVCVFHPHRVTTPNAT